LQEHGLVLNVGKCQFGVPEIDYLGHRISASGVLPMQSKVQAIRDFPQPKQIQQLQTFLGMANFYRRFIPAAACVLRPLTDAVKGGKSKQMAWGADMAAAFEEVKSFFFFLKTLLHLSIILQYINILYLLYLDMTIQVFSIS
jgi:hypothetical protein